MNKKTIFIIYLSEFIISLLFMIEAINRHDIVEGIMSLMIILIYTKIISNQIKIKISDTLIFGIFIFIINMLMMIFAINTCDFVTGTFSVIINTMNINLNFKNG